MSEKTHGGSVSYRTIMQDSNIALLASSRAAQKLGGAALSYGAMVYLARGGAGQLEVSLVSASAYLAALLFGFQSGVIVDTVTKRVAIVLGFALQAALCFLIPTFRGTDTGDLMLLVFLSGALSQLITPGLKAAVSLVASAEELATAASLVSVIGSVASAVGSSLLAPVLIKYANLDVLLYIVSALFIVSAIRAVRLPGERLGGAAESWRKLRSMPAIARRTLGDRTIAAMLTLGAIATSLFEATSAMLPVYTSDVLNADPANTVYIFAPAAIGYLLGVASGPWLIRWLGERRLVAIAIYTISLGMIAFGMIDLLAPVVARLSPLLLLEPLGLDLGDKVLAAGVIAIPANLGSSLASMALQVFINRAIPTDRQGSVFGLYDMLKNALNIVSVVSVGVLAWVVPVQYVFLATPMAIVLLVLRLVIVAGKRSGERLTTRDAWRALIGYRYGNTTS